jgi:multidrug efflux pump subunit AcrB
MWLVEAALRRPYTVWVGMLLVVVLGLVGYQRMPTDILPNLRVPVVVVFASYRGMPAPDMERSVTAVLERALTRCDHLEHIESRSLLGIGIIRVYFRSEVDPDIASSQVLALVQGEMQNLPPGMLPPSILKYDASAIPVGNLLITSQTRDDKYLLDLADHQLRDELAGIEGLAAAPVFGGVLRQVQIYVHPQTLEALKLSPIDVARIVNTQSQVIPTGEMRIGPQNYYVSSNSMLETPEAFARVPLWTDGRKVVYLGDVADVVDGQRWRTNTVRVDGRRAVYMPLLRQAGASAVKVVDNVQAFLPELHERGVVPEDVQVEVAFDQSQYVRDALDNLRLEGLSGAVLASLVVLLFLGSLRATWIVALSIPLSILAAFLGLYLTGHTLNIMTLGGIALVLGRVVDDSIVDVENTVRHLGLGKTPAQAALDSAREVSVPVLVATVTTVVVFVPLVFMEGVGKYLFTPLAVGAALAMFASYFVSRTVSPLYCSRALRPHGEKEHLPWKFLVLALVAAGVGLGAWLLEPLALHWAKHLRVLWVGRLLHGLFQALVAVGLCGAAFVVLAPVVALLFWLAPLFHLAYERFAGGYERALRFCLRWRVVVPAVILAALVPAVWCFPGVGQELFPEVDSSEFTCHVRLTGGPRVEETERQVAAIEDLVREVIPEEDLDRVLANVGISSRWSAIYTENNGPHAAFLRVQLRSGFDGRRTPTVAYVDRLRHRLEERFPGDDFFFETGGMIRRILNSGAVAPIEVQVIGRDQDVRRNVTRQLHTQIARLPQVHDTYMPQGMDLPQLRIDVDRTRAALLGFSETDVIRNVITALMSSAQIAPNFWIDPDSGNPYLIGVQYPEHQVENIWTLENVPVSSERGARSLGRPGSDRPIVRLLKDVARLERVQGPVEAYHHDVNPASQLLVNVTGNDLARVAAQVERLVDRPPLEYALDNLPANKEHLEDDEPFHRRLEQYLKKGTPALREAIRKDYGVDPERLKLPPGVRVQVRGEVSAMRRSFAEMAFALALAVVLVYLLMVALFQSFLDPLIVIVAAPLGLIGVVFTLWATDTSLNVQSCMGVLMMIGICVSNSVLLVEFANRQREAGQDVLSAIVSATRIRLRPILMTTLATIACLLPLAIHLRPGDEMNLPLARAVIGGLAVSTVLTLFVAPLLYLLLKRTNVDRRSAADSGM